MGVLSAIAAAMSEHSSPAPRLRADLLLVERGFFESRAKARAAIEAGLVRADGQPVTKVATILPRDAAIEAEAPHPWVSRGGVKLAHALDAFKIDPKDKICLDIGASTGGFSHVLLQRGARKIYAVDVGRGQIHPTIAGDPRMQVLEATDARTLDRVLIPEEPALIVSDVSFISLVLALPAALSLATSAADLVALVKPQFEAGRAALDGRGVVRNPADRQGAVAKVMNFLAEAGWPALAVATSPIAGGDGNIEFLLHARRGGEAA